MGELVRIANRFRLWTLKTWVALPIAFVLLVYLFAVKVP